MSCIDFILFYQVLLPRLNEEGFSHRLLSDHSPYWVNLRMQHNQPRGVQIHSGLLSSQRTMILQQNGIFFYRQWKLLPFLCSVVYIFKMHSRSTLISRIAKSKSHQRQHWLRPLWFCLPQKKHLLRNNLHYPSQITNQNSWTNAIWEGQTVFFINKNFEHGEKANSWLIWCTVKTDLQWLSHSIPPQGKL